MKTLTDYIAEAVDEAAGAPLSEVDGVRVEDMTAWTKSEKAKALDMAEVLVGALLQAQRGEDVQSVIDETLGDLTILANHRGTTPKEAIRRGMTRWAHEQVVALIR